MMIKNSKFIKNKIFLAGHNGMVGSAILRLLKNKGYEEIIVRSKSELDLTDYKALEFFFKEAQPEVVILAAAKVGGIKYNINFPGEMLYDNLVMQNNVIELSRRYNVKKFVFLGSSCIYPKNCEQPMKEEYLLTGKFEPTNEGYAIAKVAGLKLIEYYHKQYGFPGISLMPCNIYGTNDSFNIEKSHVLSATVKKVIDAIDEGKNEIVMWGNGEARREFMHVDDLAFAVEFLMNNYDEENFLNVGTGTDVSIKELAIMTSKIAGFDGNIKWDISKPNGMLKKCMDVSKIKSLGFNPILSLEEGIKKTISEYKSLKEENK